MRSLRTMTAGLTALVLVWGLGAATAAQCEEKPVLSGSRTISGWNLHSGNVFVADLDDGDNAGRFPNGLSQVFRGDQRLPIGRWPNLDANQDGGYSTIESQPQLKVVI